MARIVGIGLQDFGDLIRKNCFYIDKTSFIKEWWESEDSVTLITRPRRFGKTLNMSMVEQFLSVDYSDRGDLFQGLSIWKEEKYRNLQCTYPVISLSFANIKETNYANARKKICQTIAALYADYSFLLNDDTLNTGDKELFCRVSMEMDDVDATMAIHYLSKFLYLHYGKKVIILLDEYDTPMQEAYVYGYWTEMVGFTRSMFNSAFKTNSWLERAIMTGIMRITLLLMKQGESIFPDLNNLEVVTTTSDKYATAFGFTEEEVFAALDECGLSEEKEQVKRWCDGFIFGSCKDIYNPWSILNFLDTGKYTTYWANTSSNSLVGKLLREGNREIKEQFEILLRGESIQAPIDEQIVYNQLDNNDFAVWSLLLASGYLKVLSFEKEELLENGEEPERFYHGFVLGLIVDLQNKYIITSNRESGFGRYDVMLEPRNPEENDAIILEFKVHDPDDEATLKETVQAAHRQIEEKQYEAQLIARGMKREQIRSYGFAFEGKKVLIG